MTRLIHWLRGTIGIGKLKSYSVRPLVQLGFAIGSLVIGLQFRSFILAAQRGELPLPTRPAGVEGYLPISGLMDSSTGSIAGPLTRFIPPLHSCC